MSLPSEMTVVEIERPGGPEVLKTSRRPLPAPGDGEVLIKVEAAGINRPDALQRVGAYPPPPGAPDWPGLEVAGTVVELGSGVSRFRIGEPVVALLPGGGYAEYCTVAQETVLPAPAGLPMVEAAAVPETFFTVWHNVFERGGLKAGETLLVHGGTSGIGTTAIQLARAFGAKVITTAGSDAKCDDARRLGANRAINYRTEDFVEAVLDETEGRGADVILDMVGGDYVQKNCEAAAEDGRIVQIAFLGGTRSTLDMSLVMRKRLVLTGSTLRNRPIAVKGAIAEAVEREIWPLLANGAVRPVIDASYPLSQAAEAHRHLERDHVGKIVLSLAPQ
ncbi:NAD(P)H-quinone oxidoreductase [Consotaella salsifontis]|uniref:Putative NAD(P)H quinone oxidoreductase, PIG3 family n=1 Tax=Consotaella salsifontis TaxID=1365950 RepID=A0A1T4T366_9HYPH|nr:NAD(P)H-quinone oxidoreductase [Consotaella salsifontis]SKA34935.1 putative NAD(P)H quinone oxidoreductase, PIG3 family [Consotaella salsifontis]